jgi:NADPH:quinone reductase-like Zn-dependent oxidoreductase
MRAALIEAFGEPTEVLELADVPEPSGPAAGEVLVGVEYAPINMNDLYVIQGAFPVRPSLPSIVGNEGVGRVLAVGSGVEHIKVGNRVLIPLPNPSSPAASACWDQSIQTASTTSSW